MSTRTKRTLILFSLFITALCAVSCIVSVQLFLNGCLWWECAPARSFRIVDWEIPSRLLPSQTQSSHIEYDRNGQGTKGSASQGLYLDGGKGTAIYIIDRYASIDEARRSYEKSRQSFFIDRVTGISWFKPQEITYVSPSADEFFVSCGTLMPNDFRCGMIARYQEYILFFNATIGGTMTYGDFQDIVVYLDEQITNHLYQR